MTISSMNDLFELEKEYKRLELKNNSDDPGNPKKGEEFVLWRGVKDCSFDLACSLQVKVRENQKCDCWRAKIKSVEKRIFDQFLDDVKPKNVQKQLEKQYDWFNKFPGLKDTIWILSLMQHYGLPTRFLDFSSDFWSAVFFACDGAEEHKKNMALYALVAKNENQSDVGGNKLPKDCNGVPYKNANERVDMNEFLGRLVGYKGFEGKPLDLSLWNNPRQNYGWDRPRIQNPRVNKQNGFFVYPVDITKTLNEILEGDPALKKYEIDINLLPEIQNELQKRKMNSWIMYLDIERYFKGIKVE